MVTTGTKGAISELVAAVDLMAKGYMVFRALSPSCECDLMVAASGHPSACRVEVRTGNIRPNGKLSFGYAKREFEQGRFDVLAVVLPGGVRYVPEVERWFAGERASPETFLRLMNGSP